LARLRTGISLIALGLASARFPDNNLVSGFPVTTLMATLVVTSGGAISVAGGIQCTVSRIHIERGTYQSAAHVMPVAVSLVVGVGFVSLMPEVGYERLEQRTRKTSEGRLFPNQRKTVDRP
jgi:uncharacterized membrane protein YidH (DUF202 family)